MRQVSNKLGVCKLRIREALPPQEPEQLFTQQTDPQRPRDVRRAIAVERNREATTAASQGAAESREATVAAIQGATAAENTTTAIQGATAAENTTTTSQGAAKSREATATAI